MSAVAGADEKALHVMFLARRPDRAAIALLDPQRSPPDIFVVRDREIYLERPNGGRAPIFTRRVFTLRTLAPTDRNSPYNSNPEVRNLIRSEVHSGQIRIQNGDAFRPGRLVLRLRAVVRSTRLDAAEGGGPGRAKTVLS